MNSFKDDKGRQWVACCECTRGGNGSDKDKCAAGHRCVKWNGLGCYIGTVIESIITDHKNVR